VYTVTGSHFKLTLFTQGGVEELAQLIDVDVTEVKAQEDSDLEPWGNFSACA
jgi:hypothetical protein